MQHIEIVRYGEAPCGGLVQKRPVVDKGRPRSLAILGAAPPRTEEWICEGCGRLWAQEPRFDEAL